nr:PaaI family thioesterase [Geodermatophilus sp. LHW52908]
MDAAVAAARRVVAALLHTGGNSAAEMQDVAARLDAVADHLEQHAPTMADRMVDMWAGEGVTRHDPVTGPENAIAPPLALTGRDDGAIEGTTVLGLPYQGPPGFVHGGVSALLLDHTLGVANHWAGPSGMTAELTLRYHRTTPLFQPLTVTARQVSVDGRKIRTEGTITAGGEICVSAAGLFIAKQVPRPQ